MPGVPASMPEVCHPVRRKHKEARAVCESPWEDMTGSLRKGAVTALKANGKYDEIMGLPHHVSQTRPQMPMSDRAAQFAPFAALAGYDSAIREAGRLTDERIELDEEALTALDMSYQLLIAALDEEPEAELTYFKPDERKAGGAYLTVTGAVKRVDELERLIIMRDGTRIPMDDIIAMDIGMNESGPG